MGWLDFTYIHWSIYYGLEGFTSIFLVSGKRHILIQQEIMCMVYFYTFLSNSEKKFEIPCNVCMSTDAEFLAVLLFTIILLRTS